MDDLLSEDWQKPAKPSSTIPQNPNAFSSSYSSLRASPAIPQSGSVSPANISRPPSAANGTRTPSNDSFGNLLSTKVQKAGPALSMQERQKQLLEEKRREQGQQSQLWETLGSGRSTPNIRQPSPAIPQDDDDILAAFSKDAPVNKASYMSPPPPSEDVSGRSTPAVSQPTPAISGAFDDDDDPFGLNENANKSNVGVRAGINDTLNDDEDILGDLGRPVSERPTPAARRSLEEPMLEMHARAAAEPNQNGIGEDRALAELVDMGFPADTARIALAETGGNVQDAVGWLLQQAHEESRQKARGETSIDHSRSPQRRPAPANDRETVPAWMRRENGSDPASGREQEASRANGERDATQTAQEFGTKFFKSANALWKASQKQMAKTVAEFQQEGDPSQPKWMRGPDTDNSNPSSSQKPQIGRFAVAPPNLDATDEAAMLDAPRQRPSKPPRPTAPSPATDSVPTTRPSNDVLPERPPSQSRNAQQRPVVTEKRPATKLSRQDVEDQTANAYVSPARRKRSTPKPEPPPEPEVDLFGSPAPPAAVSNQPRTKSLPQTRPIATPPTSRPSHAPSKSKAPPRTIPPVSPSALSASANYRKAGGEHFKRGDFAAAHESYTAALTPLPPTHPIAIIVLSNRSLTALKTGDAKVAVSDADRALEIVGPGLGVGEVIDLGNGDGTKDMKEFYGKALMRKAEALEHMEKYADAAAVWRLAIAAGVGGAVSLRGRDRCDKAATPQPATIPSGTKPSRNTTTAPARAPPAKSLGNSTTRPTLTSASSHEAVKKLRAANAEAEKADDEKFALADSVDAKLTAWRGGKTDNLRALLQSMNTVLWEAAGWKKVGMSDLVMPAKVKIVYMKAIAKVHPDKIPQDATTEQRMLSAAVFATLNESWDKFRTENGL